MYRDRVEGEFRATQSVGAKVGRTIDVRESTKGRRTAMRKFVGGKKVGPDNNGATRASGNVRSEDFAFRACGRKV